MVYERHLCPLDSLAPVAQWIEQPPSKRSVDGSIPSGRVDFQGSQLPRAGLMQSKTVDLEAMYQEDEHWLEANLSYLSELEPYDWGDADPQIIGKLIRSEQGVGFVIESGKGSGQVNLAF
jgi:hypothetical protein